MEKSNLGIFPFNLQSKMRAHDKVPCTLKEGKMRRNSNLAWESLEKAEYEQELAIWEEPTRQKKNSNDLFLLVFMERIA